ncbi:MAG TPA: HAMP domain-containing sensor histidine kinase [Ktedonobacterales bacterium]|nr:HAMP domain-containing sensor histidine kinase [Ktedonobacterales bacterium]
MNTIDSVSALDAPSVAQPSSRMASGMASGASAPAVVAAARPPRPKRAPRASATTRAAAQSTNSPGADLANALPATAPSAQPKTPTKTQVAARAANQRRVADADFPDLIGHELRAPMTILKGQAQLLQRRLRREGGREADLGDLDKMLFQIERLNHQVGALLNVTHLAQRRMTLVPAAFDLAPSVQHIVAVCAAGNPNVAIHYAAPTEPLVGRWDRQRIESVIRELLFNAIKYGGAEIIVRLTREPDPVKGRGHSGEQARLEVEDHGIGVPAGERNAIFGEGVQASNAAHTGIGLGLYVAREIVRRHHGRIGVRPHTPKGAPGSIFWLTLPLAPA